MSPSKCNPRATPSRADGLGSASGCTRLYIAGAAHSATIRGLDRLAAARGVRAESARRANTSQRDTNCVWSLREPAPSRQPVVAQWSVQVGAIARGGAASMLARTPRHCSRRLRNCRTPRRRETRHWSGRPDRRCASTDATSHGRRLHARGDDAQVALDRVASTATRASTSRDTRLDEHGRVGRAPSSRARASSPPRPRQRRLASVVAPEISHPDAIAPDHELAVGSSITRLLGWM